MAVIGALDADVLERARERTPVLYKTVAVREEKTEATEDPEKSNNHQRRRTSAVTC